MIMSIIRTTVHMFSVIRRFCVFSHAKVYSWYKVELFQSLLNNNHIKHMSVVGVLLLHVINSNEHSATYFLTSKL